MRAEWAPTAAQGRHRQEGGHAGAQRPGTASAYVWKPCNGCPGLPGPFPRHPVDNVRASRALPARSRPAIAARSAKKEEHTESARVATALRNKGPERAVLPFRLPFVSAFHWAASADALPARGREGLPHWGETERTQPQIDEHDRVTIANFIVWHIQMSRFRLKIILYGSWPVVAHCGGNIEGRREENALGTGAWRWTLLEVGVPNTPQPARRGHVTTCQLA